METIIISTHENAMTLQIDGEWVSVTEYMGEVKVGSDVTIFEYVEIPRRFRKAVSGYVEHPGIIVELHPQEVARVYAGGKHWWMCLRTGEVVPVQ